jgi:hypothetical protein
MTAFVRLAGSGILADGSRLVWSVADGRRGRRWRAVASADGVMTHALLLEVDLDGRPSRLELATSTGMLTLHPDDARQSLHGNAVLPDGVRHLRLAWSDEHGLEVEGRPIATAVSARRLARTIAVGEGRTIPVVLITATLEVSETTRRFVRLGETEWRIEPDTSASVAGGAGAPQAISLIVDGRGIPVGLGNAREWPLELG